MRSNGRASKRRGAGLGTTEGKGENFTTEETAKDSQYLSKGMLGIAYAKRSLKGDTRGSESCKVTAKDCSQKRQQHRHGCRSESGIAVVREVTPASLLAKMIPRTA